MLRASHCLQTLKELILDLGGTIIERSRVTHIAHDNLQRPVQIHLHGRESIQADRVVVAVGPWIHQLLEDLQIPIHMTRQYVLYFANVPFSSFALHSFPAFFADDLYGLPIYSTCTGSGPAWFKGASHNFGIPLTDPDETPYIDERLIAQTARRLRDLLPALQHAELAHVDTCMYDVSPDEDFILDHVPDDSRIVFATGMTGHAFKFGLVLGELLSSLLCDTEPLVPMGRFSLARFAQQRQLRTSSVA
jgi:glycine/D-amino acid oxidase-like deaminating enzyme